MLVSCQEWFGDGSRLQSGRNDHLEGIPVTPPEESTPEEKGNDTTVFVTAISYPAGVDWVRDSGAEGARLILFANGEEILNLPVGERYLISPDTDMHRVCRGHLYSDYSTGNETVVFRDGKELFRFPGRESLKGFYIQPEETVFTLGQSRDGVGWTLRRNGEVVASDTESILLQESDSHSFPYGALQAKEEHIWFFYHIPRIGWKGIRPGEFFLWKDGETTPVSLPELTDKVFDIRIIDDKTVMCYSASSSPEILVDGSSFSPGSHETIPSRCRLFPTGDGDFRIAGSAYSYESGWDAIRLWDRRGLIKLFDQGVSVGEFCFEDGNMAYVSALEDGYAEKAVKSGTGETFALPADSRFVARRCALLYKGKLYLALSGEGPRNSRSGLWIDGEFTPYEINGPLTGVWVEP